MFQCDPCSVCDHVSHMLKALCLNECGPKSGDSAHMLPFVLV